MWFWRIKILWWDGQMAVKSFTRQMGGFKAEKWKGSDRHSPNSQLCPSNRKMRLFWDLIYSLSTSEVQVMLTLGRKCVSKRKRNKSQVEADKTWRQESNRRELKKDAELTTTHRLWTDSFLYLSVTQMCQVWVITSLRFPLTLENHRDQG